MLNAPKPRVKSAALQARLALLQKQLEQQQYDAMVQDITHAVSVICKLLLSSGLMLLSSNDRYLLEYPMIDVMFVPSRTGARGNSKE